MKLIHLNVEYFKYFDALVDFLEVEKPDIISLVEAVDGDFLWSGKERDYIGDLEEKFGWNSVFHPTVFRDFGEYRLGFGAAVMSRFPLTLESAMYFGDQKPSVRPRDDIIFSDRPKYERYPYAWKLNLPFLSTTVATEKWPLRLLTAHFHVSYECLETLQIWQDAEKVVEYINKVKPIPTILTGDLNIRNESMTIKTLSEKLTQESKKLTNTLCPSLCPYFDRVPGGRGLGIDHIFTRDIVANTCEVRDVVVSDHLPLVLDFSL